MARHSPPLRSLVRPQSPHLPPPSQLALCLRRPPRIHSLQRSRVWQSRVQPKRRHRTRQVLVPETHAHRSGRCACAIAINNWMTNCASSPRTLKEPSDISNCKRTMHMAFRSVHAAAFDFACGQSMRSRRASTQNGVDKLYDVLISHMDISAPRSLVCRSRLECVVVCVIAS